MLLMILAGNGNAGSTIPVHHLASDTIVTSGAMNNKVEQIRVAAPPITSICNQISPCYWKLGGNRIFDCRSNASLRECSQAASAFLKSYRPPRTGVNTYTREICYPIAGSQKDVCINLPPVTQDVNPEAEKNQCVLNQNYHVINLGTHEGPSQKEIRDTYADALTIQCTYDGTVKLRAIGSHRAIALFHQGSDMVNAHHLKVKSKQRTNFAIEFRASLWKAEEGLNIASFIVTMDVE
ncbi:hypothetical protein ACNSPD_04065 [Yersinia enterocolitica]|uniref:hypothetical protein n=1 Tax=Yersinia enterocolitica TaxID=630 RepID=UPI003AB3C655